MSRRCECDRTVKDGSPYVRGRDCPKCYLWHNNPKSRAFMETGETPATGARELTPPPKMPAAVPPDDCLHLGRELTGPERDAAGLDHARRWALCLHPATPLGPNVCPCKGCGPACPGYPKPGDDIPSYFAGAADNYAESPVGLAGWVFTSDPSFAWPDDDTAAYGKYGRVPWAMFRRLVGGTPYPNNYRAYPSHEVAYADGAKAIEDMRAGKPAPPPTPLSLVEVGPEGLSKGRSGFAFNAGLIRYKGHLLLCYRTDWAGSHCHVAELNEDYSPRRSVVLPQLTHPWAMVGREDPRLFVFRGRLHVAYIGVERVGKGEIRTSQLYARLSDDLRVEEVFAPEYQFRRAWEKNWQFFEWAGELFCVYSIAPHVILHVRGNKAHPFAETPTEFPWSGGHLRGGAPPVLVGDRFYHWFHGRRDTDWTYNVGLYTFEAKPPFRVLSLTPDPLLWGDPGDRDGNYCAVTFPGGALLEAGRWRVAMGWNDRKVKVAEWGEEEVAVAVGHSRTSRPNGVVITAVLTNGRDDFHTGRKVTGRDQAVGELSAADQVEYVRPFLTSVERFGVTGVVLHDGLGDDVIRACPGLRFAVAVGLPAWNAFERRWVAARNYLAARDDLARVWFVDANDLVFVTAPFAWMDAHVRPGQIAVGQERVAATRGNDWFESGVAHLPAEFARLTGEYGDLPGLSCGAWGADRETAIAVLDAALARIVRAERHLAARPPTPACVDMFAFGLVWREQFGDRLVPFAMDGETVVGGVPSPLIHDRAKALATVVTS